MKEKFTVIKYVLLGFINSIYSLLIRQGSVIVDYNLQFEIVTVAVPTFNASDVTSDIESYIQTIDIINPGRYSNHSLLPRTYRAQLCPPDVPPGGGGP